MVVDNRAISFRLSQSIIFLVLRVVSLEALCMIGYAGRNHTRLCSIIFIMSAENIFLIKNRKFWKELNVYFHLIRNGLHRKRSIKQFIYCCVCVRCRGNAFTEPLPSNDSEDALTDPGTDGRDFEVLR
jgi:hypothetical protein